METASSAGKTRSLRRTSCATSSASRAWVSPRECAVASANVLMRIRWGSQEKPTLKTNSVRKSAADVDLLLNIECPQQESHMTRSMLLALLLFCGSFVLLSMRAQSPSRGVLLVANKGEHTLGIIDP